MAFILYELIDVSRPDAIRYVGKTGQRINKRLNHHLSVATKGDRTHRSCWIRSVIMSGRSVMANVVVMVSSEAEINSLEIQHIKLRRAEGCDLVNQTDGGEGAPGRAPTNEFRQKMRAVNIGKILSPEHRRKLSEAKKGNQHLRGYVPTNETQRKLTEANKLRPPFSAEWLVNLKASQLARRARERAEAAQ